MLEKIYVDPMEMYQNCPSDYSVCWSKIKRGTPA